MAPGLTTNGRKQPAFAVSTGEPPTSTRLPAIDADDFITKAGVARANAAVSTSKPDGDRKYTADNQEYVRLYPSCSMQDHRLNIPCRPYCNSIADFGIGTMMARFIPMTPTWDYET